MSMKTVASSLLAVLVLFAFVQHQTAANAGIFDWSALVAERVAVDESTAVVGSLSVTRANSLISSPGSNPKSRSGSSTWSLIRVGGGEGMSSDIGRYGESLRLRNSSAARSPKSSSAAMTTGRIASGVANETDRGSSNRTNGRLSGSTVTGAVKRSVDA